MNPFGPKKASKKSSLDRVNPSCADLMTMAERELAAFLSAVTQMYGSGQVELSAEDWLHELIESDGLPASAHEWRWITAKVSSRLAHRVYTASLLTTASFLSTESQSV